MVLTISLGFQDSCASRPAQWQGGVALRENQWLFLVEWSHLWPPGLAHIPLAGARWAPWMAKGERWDHPGLAVCGSARPAVGACFVEGGACTSNMLEPSIPPGAHLDCRYPGFWASSSVQAHFPRVVFSGWLQAAFISWLTAGNLILEASAQAWGVSTRGLMSWKGACWCFQPRNPNEAFGLGSPHPPTSGVS